MTQSLAGRRSLEHPRILSRKLAPAKAAILFLVLMLWFLVQPFLCSAQPGEDPKADTTTVQPGEPADKNKWQFIVGPLEGWLAGMEGHATANGTRVDIDVPLHDILDQLETYYQAYLEARYERCGLYFQPLYMKLESENKQAHLDAEGALKSWIVDLAGFYRVAELGEERPLTIEALGGVRYWNMDTDLELTATVTGPLGRTRTRVFQGGATADLLDPIVGLRAKKYLTEKLFLNLQGDIGGFDISSDTSKFTWQAVGLVGYDFTKRFSALAGYRALSLDYESSSGSNKAELDIVIHGAVLSMRLTF